MSRIKVVSHERVEPSRGLVEATERLALELRAKIREEKWVAQLAVERIVEGPTLHLDDLSEIALVGDAQSDWYYQDRARLRADTGDVVACSRPVEGSYESYCRDWLGMGEVEWLVSEQSGKLGGFLAARCWADQGLRRQLIERVRAGRLEVIHPHMGIKPVWALAESLFRETGRRVRVLGPPPELCERVNHKGWFAAVVNRLLGPMWVPRVECADNFTTVARLVAKVAKESRLVGVKLPDSAGGEGNVVLEAEPLRGMKALALRELLQERLAHLRWSGEDVLLVSPWLENVVGTPSVQTWIVPTAEGEPVVEGVFDQIVTGQRGRFVGSIPSKLDEGLRSEIATQAWLLARVFQRLGYVGRCSFDLILTEEDVGARRPRFIECNGRWGGTSGPMLMMSRVMGDWKSRPYASFESVVAGVKELGFAKLMERLGPVLHDGRTGRGWLLLYNPGFLAKEGGVRYVALGDSTEEAVRRAMQDVPQRLKQVVEESGGPSTAGGLDCLNPYAEVWGHQ